MVRHLYPEGDFALSPDGQSLVTELKVPEVPASWETLYPAPARPFPPLRAGLGRLCAPVRSDQTSNRLCTSLNGRAD